MKSKDGQEPRVSNMIQGESTQMRRILRSLHPSVACSATALALDFRVQSLQLRQVPLENAQILLDQA